MHCTKIHKGSVFPNVKNEYTLVKPLLSHHGKIGGDYIPGGNGGQFMEFWRVYGEGNKSS